MEGKAYFDWGRAIRWDSRLRLASKMVALHLLDRVGCLDPTKTTCYPSMADIQAMTDIDERTAYRAVKQLEDLGICSVSREAGMVNEYSLRPVDGWSEPPPNGDRGVHSARGGRLDSTPPPNGDSTPPPNGDTRNLSINVSSNVSENGSHTCSPQSGERLFNDDQKPKAPAKTKPTVSAETVESIYQAYPRKVGKAAAVKAIVKAIQELAKRPDVTDPGLLLLIRTQQYADSPAGRKPANGKADYRPHPRTWFSQGRYDDDQTEWKERAPADRDAGRLDLRDDSRYREFLTGPAD